MPGKNLREMHGFPLIHWTIQAGLLSDLDAIYVSTEDADIRSYCGGYEGLQVIARPPELADDLASTVAVIYHALEVVECDRLMLLQPTSPLRTHEHINEALELGTCISVTHGDGAYWPNGAIYLMDAGHPMRFRCCYIMRDSESVDVDTQEDFDRAEYLLERRH